MPGEHVLVIDDSIQIRDFIIDCVLKPNGFQIESARDGYDGLQKALDTPHLDLIILDYEMPKLNGIQVLESLSGKQIHIPTILVTSHGSEEIAVQALRLGVRNYLIKPFTIDELLGAIEQALTEARLRRERDLLNLKLDDLNHQLEARVHDLNILHEISSKVTAMITHTDLLTRIVEAALYVTGAEEGAIFSMDTASNRIQLQVDLHRGYDHASPVASEKAQITAVQAIWAKKPISTASTMFIPLIVGTEVLGALGVSNSVTTRYLADHDRVMLQSLGDYTAIVIQNAHLFQELQLSKEREKLKLRNLFEQFVSPQVVERLINSPQAAALGGVRQPTTILFADIRGFTAYAEQAQPETLMEVLNRYIAAAASAVLEQEGTLDKFMGDAVMALFNAPLPQPDYALCATRAAVRIQESVTQIHKELPEPLHMQFGIGIGSGEAVVGNIGTAKLMNYTALGDCVNVAKRLQESASGGQILLSSSTYDLVKDNIQVKPLGPVLLKGRVIPEVVYELVELK